MGSNFENDGKGLKMQEEIDATDVITKLLEESKSETVDLVVEHELPGVTPEMIDWWWDNIGTTERYKLWHLEDRFSFEWEVSPSKSGHIGAIQIAREKFGEFPGGALRIRWEDPSSVPISTTYSHVLAASILGHDDEPISWIVHEYDAESYGTRMRSTFRLPAKVPQQFLDALRKHNKEEMWQFTEFLPELYTSRGE